MQALACGNLQTKNILSGSSYRSKVSETSKKKEV